MIMNFSWVLPGKPCELAREEQDSSLLPEDLNKNFCIFDAFWKQISDTWLQWFIGFSEADGAILSAGIYDSAHLIFHGPSVHRKISVIKVNLDL